MPELSAEDLQRVAVIGTSCSGKTTFAKRLAEALNREHIELDAINWLPEWTARPPEEFRKLVEEAIAKDEWILDGNYHRVRELVWSRATTLIWLDYPFRVVLFRALSRTLRRSISKEILFSGNRESLRMAFMSRDSILLWVLKTYHRRRREYSTLLDERPDLRVVVLRSSEQADRFLAEIRSKMFDTLFSLSF